MTNYRNAKGKLFENLVTSKKKRLGKKKVEKTSVINIDDREAKYFGAFPAMHRLTFGLKKSDFSAQNIKHNTGLSFDVNHLGKSYHLESKLVGQFNIYNILAAWAVARSLGIEPKVIKQGIEDVGAVKGRMEKVAESKGVQYYIDYAMTPDSYEMLFDEMKRIAKGKVIAVFGAAGDRDKSKRPLIGAIAAKKADFTILTEDEPYSEDPKKIIEEIEVGFKKQNATNYKIISDRKKALAEAAKIAKSGDVVVVPGIGHQAYRNVGGDKKIVWNEAEIIKGLVK